MVSIETLNQTHLNRLANVALASEQLKFACSAKEFIQEVDPAVHLHVIKQDDEIIGFFKLDTHYGKHYDFCPTDGLGLRSFVIDEKQQGNGLGKQAIAALLKYLTQYYGDYNWLYLTVNCKNAIAQRCYQKSGFTEAESLYLGGPAGSQHIMYKAL